MRISARIRPILMTLIVVLAPIMVRADHIYGGQITCELVDHELGIYDVELKLRRKCGSSALSSSQHIVVYSCQSAPISMSLELSQRQIATNACSLDGACSSMANQNFELYTYRGRMLIGQNCGMARIVYQLPHSRAFSHNLTTLNENFCIYTDINTNLDQLKSGEWNHNYTHEVSLGQKYHAQIDYKSETCDSMSWELVTPLQSITGFSQLVSSPMNAGLSAHKPLYVTENTIEIKGLNYSYTPNLEQQSWISYRVKEYQKITINGVESWVVASIRHIDELVKVSNLNLYAIISDINLGHQPLLKVAQDSFVSCSAIDRKMTLNVLITNQTPHTTVTSSYHHVSKHLTSTRISGTDGYDTLRITIDEVDAKSNAFQMYHLILNTCIHGVSYFRHLFPSIWTSESQIFADDTMISCSPSSLLPIPLYHSDGYNILTAHNQSFVTQRGDSVWMYPNAISGTIIASHRSNHPICPQNDTLQLYVRHEIKDSIVVSHVSCYGYDDATAEVIPIGNNGPYRVMWNIENNWVIADRISNLKKGNYQYKIVDGLKCEKSNLIKIEEPEGIIWQWETTQPILCHGAQNASGQIKVLGSLSPSQYIWNSFVHNQSSLTNLSAGTYTGKLQYTNRNQKICNQNIAIVINQPDSIKLNFLTTHNKCNGDSLGQIVIMASGGRGGYMYTIDSLAMFSEIARNLPARSYSIRAKDIHGCMSDNYTVSVGEPEPIIPTLEVTSPRCAQSKDGVIQIKNVIGGSGDYLFKIGSSGEYVKKHDFYGLDTSSNVTISIKDNNGCIADTTVSMSPQYQLDAIVHNIQHLTCPNINNGRLVIEAIGGSPPFTISYLNKLENRNQNTIILDSMPSGHHIFSLTDMYGCRHEKSLMINSPQPVKYTQSNLTPKCYNSADGAIDVQISGGTPPYHSYLWNQAQSNTSSIQNIIGGDYTLSFQDANNCKYQYVANLPAPAPIIIETHIKKSPTCHYTADGEVIAKASNGIAPYRYLWSPNVQSRDSLAYDLKAFNTYSLSVIDAEGCSQTHDMSINDVYRLDMSNKKIKHPSCPQLANGGVQIHVPYNEIMARDITFGISEKGILSKTPNFMQLSSGLYHIEATDKYGCRYLDSVLLTANASLNLVLMPRDTSISPGAQVTLKADWTLSNQDTVSVTKVEWTPNRWLECKDCLTTHVAPYTDTRYYIKVTQSNGCESLDSSHIRVSDLTEVYIPNAFSPNADQTNDCWRIYGHHIASVDIYLYAPNGQLVWKSHDLNQCFDGRIEGEYLISNAYRYWIKIQYKNDIIKYYQGHLNIIR